MEARLLVGSIEDSRFCTLVREQLSVNVEFESFGNLVLELDVCAKNVRGSPGLGDCETMFAVRPLGLDVAGNSFRFGVTVSGSLEGYTRRGGSLDFKTDSLERKVFAEQVIGGLSKVLVYPKASQKKVVRDG